MKTSTLGNSITILFRFLLSILFILPNRTALACSLTEEGHIIFQSLCPTGKLESDCTCNILGIYFDVLGINSIFSSLEYVFVLSLIIIIIVILILIVTRKRFRQYLKSRKENEN
jgi:hypothetical protein